MDKRRQVWERVLEYDHDEYENYNDYEISSLVDQVYSSQSTEEKKTLSCSDTYITCHPLSSWEHLNTLLYKEDEMTAVDQARPFLPHRG